MKIGAELGYNLILGHGRGKLKRGEVITILELELLTLYKALS